MALSLLRVAEDFADPKAVFSDSRFEAGVDSRSVHPAAAITTHTRAQMHPMECLVDTVSPNFATHLELLFFGFFLVLSNISGPNIETL